MSAFISADYMMSKNLPYGGESAQPGKTYYLMKLVCDVFRIVDHLGQKSYTYICDEIAACSKSTDHTTSFLQHFIDTHVDSWIRKLTVLTMQESARTSTYLLGY